MTQIMHQSVHQHVNQPVNQTPQAVSLEHIPSIHATAPSEQVSERYGFIPTSVIVTALEREGFIPVNARAARSRPDRAPFAKHMLRFRHRDHLVKQVGDWLPEIVLLNAHDGSACYRIMAGIFRLVCLNGLVVGSSFADLRVRHTKNAASEVVDASFRVIEALPRIGEDVQAMRAVDLSEAERLAFATSALALRFEDEAPIRAAQLLEPRRHADTATDLWTSFNTVQEHLLRGGDRTITTGSRRRGKTRQISSVGEDVRLNRALWTLAEEMARLKTAG